MKQQEDNQFYGWFVVAGVMLVWFITSGTFFFSFGVFLPVMSEALSWSRTAAGGGFTIAILLYGLTSPIIGISVSKFGPRKNIVLGNTIAALGMFGMSQCRELWHLYLFFGVLVGAGTSFGQYVACTTLINNWFDHRRPLCIGLILSAGSLAGFVFPPLTSWIIAKIGWQPTWIVYGVLVLVFAVIIGGLLIIRNKPEDMNQNPLKQKPLKLRNNVNPLSVSELVQDTDSETISPEWKTKQLLTKPTIWIIIVIGAANYYAWGTVNAHQVALLLDRGFSTMASAVIFSVALGVGVVGRIGLGILEQWISLRKLLIISFLMQMSAFIILLQSESAGLIYCYSILFGISSGALMAAFPTLVSDYSGRTQYPKIMGIVFTVVVIIQSFGPIVAGTIYDYTESYLFALIIVILLLFCGLVCATLLRSSKLYS